MIRWAISIAVAAGLAAPVGSASSEPAPRIDLAHALDRLVGHRHRIDATGRLHILDIAGQGPARIGVIERDGDRLVLVERDGGRHRLAGPLAIPRIAGPGYTVWVLGQRRGEDMWVERIGVLAARGAPRAADLR